MNIKFVKIILLLINTTHFTIKIQSHGDSKANLVLFKHANGLKYIHMRLM